MTLHSKLATAEGAPEPMMGRCAATSLAAARQAFHECRLPETSPPFTLCTLQYHPARATVQWLEPFLHGGEFSTCMANLSTHVVAPNMPPSARSATVGTQTIARDPDQVLSRHGPVAAFCASSGQHSGGGTAIL